MDQKRILLTVGYDGTEYCGWQYQDNGPSIQQEIEKALEDSGFKVEHACDGVECVDMLTKAEAGYYDMILMDIQMPNLNGYEATRKIRNLDDKAKANIIIVAMTANAFKEDKERALEVGMNDHLAKPIDVKKMMDTLTYLFKKAEA